MTSTTFWLIDSRGFASARHSLNRIDRLRSFGGTVPDLHRGRSAADGPADDPADLGGHDAREASTRAEGPGVP